MKCGVRSASLKREECSVKCEESACLALHCAGVVRRSCSRTTSAQQLRTKRARTGLAHGACKFDRWKRAHSRSLRQLPPRLVRVLLVTWVENKCIDQCQGENENHIESPANPSCFVAVLCKQLLSLVRGICPGKAHACTKQSLRENLHPLPRVVRAKEICFPHRLIHMLDCSSLCSFQSLFKFFRLLARRPTTQDTNDTTETNAKKQDRQLILLFCGEKQSSVFGSRVLRRLTA